ncbi:unnamed protein product [Ambrosiozyma monospora]|uniref:Unnamed protein product n=1 Tax=Ambrosiozyma monospora TaxID=43982 RepID=A0ACB5U971_AMBMO|nr:unnamed protein product [Ambrosiozyma monospora]
MSTLVGFKTEPLMFLLKSEPVVGNVSLDNLMQNINILHVNVKIGNGQSKNAQSAWYRYHRNIVISYHTDKSSNEKFSAKVTPVLQNVHWLSTETDVDDDGAGDISSNKTNVLDGATIYSDFPPHSFFSSMGAPSLVTDNSYGQNSRSLYSLQ